MRERFFHTCLTDDEAEGILIATTGDKVKSMFELQEYNKECERLKKALKREKVKARAFVNKMKA
ncbi:MAG: hypothetical protein ACRCYA_02465, partial [Cetobacterium sp.]